MTEVRLGDVADLRGGYAFKSGQYTESGRFVLRTVNIRDDCSITSEGSTFISEAAATEYGRFSLQRDDTLFVMVGATLGKIGFVREANLPALLNQNIWVIRALPGKADPIYLHYRFRELSKIPLTWVGGSARSFLRRDDVRNLVFDLPPLEDQLRIGQFLGSLDNKIELNRRMSATLEAMAQALFRDWFIDFGPTRRKIDGATDPVAIMGGLVSDPERARELAELFPARLGDDGLPEGFAILRVEDIAHQHTASVKPLAFPEEIFVHYSLPAFDKGQNPILETGASILSSKTIIPADAILLSKLNPEIPRVWLPEEQTDRRAICSTEFLTFTAERDFGRAFIYSLFRSRPFRELLAGMVTGTSKSHQRIAPKALAKQPVLATSVELAAEYEAVVAPLLSKVQHNRAENRTLAATRDLLLPKLMSGEIRLSDAPEIVEAAQ